MGYVENGASPPGPTRRHPIAVVCSSHTSPPINDHVRSGERKATDNVVVVQNPVAILVLFRFPQRGSIGSQLHDEFIRVGRPLKIHEIGGGMSYLPGHPSIPTCLPELHLLAGPAKIEEPLAVAGP